MIYGSTKTKLDYIVENGLMRMDAAVEGVIARYPTTVNPCNAGTLHIYEKGATVDKSTYADEQLRDVAIGMGMAGIVAHRDYMREQRAYYHQLSIAAQQASLSRQQQGLAGGYATARGFQGLSCNQVSGLGSVNALQVAGLTGVFPGCFGN